MNYTNHANIPLPLAVFLATDNYDHEENTISATTLLKPTKQIILDTRLSPQERITDIASLVSSRMGSAIHTAIEQAWLNPSEALQRLGYPTKVIERIKVNPDTINDKDIPVYMEKRSYKQVGDYTISGKFDFVAEGKVQDFKSTSVWTYLNQSNADKYRLQGSIYRWLNPDIISSDTMTIHYIFTDWNAQEARRNKEYPTNRVISQEYPLLSIQDTGSFIKAKLADIAKYKDTPEQQLPPCTDDDLWRKPTIWKYYKNPAKTDRSTKNFDTQSEAIRRYVEDGSVGTVQEVKGQVVACKYCPVFHLCTQKDTYIASGELTL